MDMEEGLLMVELRDSVLAGWVFEGPRSAAI